MKKTFDFHASCAYWNKLIGNITLTPRTQWYTYHVVHGRRVGCERLTVDVFM